MLGRTLIVFGALLLVAGILVVLGVRIPLLGKLPGDITWRRGNLTVYLPLTSMVVLSILLTLVVRFISRR